MLIDVPDRFIKEVKSTVKKLHRKEKRQELSQKYRDKGTDFWNNHVDYINQQMDNDKDREDAYFKWCVLVKQEIFMYAAIAKPIVDLEWLCDRRGFNETQKKFLTAAIAHMGMQIKEDTEEPRKDTNDDDTEAG